MGDNIIFLQKKLINNLIEKGNKELFSGNIDEAKKYFEEAYQKDPENTTVLYNLAALYVESGNTDKSEDFLIKAFDKDPNHLFTLIGLANIIYYKTENFELASKYLQTAFKHHQNSPELHTSYGNLLMLEQNLKEAIKYFQNALDIDKEYAPAISGISNVYNSTGLRYLSKHHFDQAFFSFKKSIEYNPDWLAPQLNLVRTYGFMKKYKMAFEMINSIKQLFEDETDLDYIIKMGTILEDKSSLLSPFMIKITEAKLLQQVEKLEEAEDIFKKLYKINDRFPTLNFSLALIELEKNRLENAEKFIKEELTISPYSVKVKIVRYIIYKKMDRISSWETHFNIIKKTTDDVYKLFDSAVLLKKYGLNDEADALFEYSKRLNPNLFEELKSKTSDSTINALHSTYPENMLI
ncbi:tetratricopeptide repeat protein [bacterium]|nr:tetratricopeptide repeat protein [bacterium]